MVDGKTQQIFEELNGRLKGQPYKLGILNMEDIEFLEKNARYMPNEMFKNLVENIRRDGGLTSVPLCYMLANGKYRVLSGNHRVKAAKEAGVENFVSMYIDHELSREEEVAIQLSHNAIEGRDDLQILRSLWQEIDDLSLKYYSGLDDKTLQEMEAASLKALAEIDLSYKSLSFLFLSGELDEINAVFEKATGGISSDCVRISRAAEFDRAIEAMAKAKAAYNVKSSAVALQLVLDVFERNMECLQEGWVNQEDNQRRSWIPLASIFGTDCVPADVGKILVMTLDKMISRQEVDVKSKWKMLELLSADYLGGE